MNKVRAAYKRSLTKDEERMKTAISSSKCSMWGGRLVAHEIDHGVYKFQHTFDYGVAEKSTDNLMDYNNDDFLAHYQWRVMQDSVMFVWKGLQDDEDGMWTTDGHYYLFKFLSLMMGYDYNTADLYGRLAERPDSYVLTQEDINKNKVTMGNGQTFSLNPPEGFVIKSGKVKNFKHVTHLTIGDFDFYLSENLFEWPDITLTKKDIENGMVLVGQDGYGNPKYFTWHKYSAGDMLENSTWLIGGTQQRYHALTGQSHGMELAATVYAIKNYFHEDNNDKYLLHRFGDCFAHHDVDNKLFVEAPLTKYINAFDINLLKYYKEMKVGEKIPVKWANDPTICANQIVYENGIFYTTYSKDEFKKEICYMILKSDSKIIRYEKSYENVLLLFQTIYSIEELNEFFLNKVISPCLEQDKYVMYGDNTEGMIKFTSGHGIDSYFFDNPDAILERPTIYLCYVHRALELLNFKSLKESLQIEDDKVTKAYDAIKELIDWCRTSLKEKDEKKKIDKNARLDGCLSFLIAHFNGDGEFDVPIKWIHRNVQKSSSRAKIFYSDFNIVDSIEDAKKQCRIVELYFDYLKNKPNSIFKEIRRVGSNNYSYRYKIIYK